MADRIWAMALTQWSILKDLYLNHGQVAVRPKGYLRHLNLTLVTLSLVATNVIYYKIYLSLSTFLSIIWNEGLFDKPLQIYKINRTVPIVFAIFDLGPYSSLNKNYNSAFGGGRTKQEKGIYLFIFCVFSWKAEVKCKTFRLLSSNYSANYYY